MHVQLVEKVEIFSSEVYDMTDDCYLISFSCLSTFYRLALNDTDN